MAVEVDREHLLSPAVQHIGSWAVTEYGLEYLPRYYPISKKRLLDSGYPVEKHMAEKAWCNQAEFRAALRAARKHHGGPVARVRAFPGLGLRFQVLRRDEYRCCICGREAADGVKLEVDHRVARSKGGMATLDNLWTLCFDCNRGKGTKSY